MLQSAPSARLSDTLEFSTYFNLILNYEKYTQDKFFNCVYLAKVKLIFGQKIRSYPTMNHVELFRNPSICVTAVIR